MRGNSALFKGAFTPVINDDSIEIYWSTQDAVYDDGLLLTLTFDVISDIQEDFTNIILENVPIELGTERFGADLEVDNIELLLNHTPVVTDITLKSKPSKLTYELCEEFDASGMVIEAIKDDGSVETITDYTVTGFETNSVGTKTVTVSYGDKSVSFDIEVVHNHTWGEWQTVSSPNSIDKGPEKRICSVCKESEMRDVDPFRSQLG